MLYILRYIKAIVDDIKLVKSIYLRIVNTSFLMKEVELSPKSIRIGWQKFLPWGWRTNKWEMNWGWKKDLSYSRRFSVLTIIILCKYTKAAMWIPIIIIFKIHWTGTFAYSKTYSINHMALLVTKCVCSYKYTTPNFIPCYKNAWYRKPIDDNKLVFLSWLLTDIISLLFIILLIYPFLVPCW